MIKFPQYLLFILLLPGSLWAELNLEVRNLSFLHDQAFRRLPELFTGVEYTGNKIFVRSTPEERSGFYFVVIVNGEAQDISEKYKWEISWVSSSNPELMCKNFPQNNTDFFKKEIFIGLTGKDWSDESVYPLAWRIRLLDEQSSTLAESKVFCGKSNFLFSQDHKGFLAYNWEKKPDFLAGNG